MQLSLQNLFQDCFVGYCFVEQLDCQLQIIGTTWDQKHQRFLNLFPQLLFQWQTSILILNEEENFVHFLKEADKLPILSWITYFPFFINHFGWIIFWIWILFLFWIFTFLFFFILILLIPLFIFFVYLLILLLLFVHLLLRMFSFETTY